ncbi:Beauvericin cluster-specific repressor BEA4 [Colletotrichum orbiculare MAFF 240422]|uniref:Beauvericin cluster-specific repressor BEA4 n=1 Tax=Colletotrichum orbiculare (strain 104-T / ATCC 96160 / CBS 514.97 / LARS 414 / MAFF 240422) TaxID=1213857 RepID=N4VDV3_COLOR|nr:Beauvericin cluster-specific repressor BEA4 [Colletotrichum orbiculare MAFF 240422]
MVRSRGGCSNCKRRKRKCDETRPDCRACQRRGIQCEGYNTTLKWTNGIASRGRYAGAAIPDPSLATGSGSGSGSGSGPGLIPSSLPDPDEVPEARAPAPNPTHTSSTQAHAPSRVASSSSTSSPGAEDSLAQQQQQLPPGSTSGRDAAAAEESRIIGAGIPRLDASPGANIDPKRQLFDKFLTAGLHRLYTTESHIWLQSHFTEMAGRSQAFFVVCTAIQAYLDGGFSVTAMEHVDHALQTFRAELEGRHGSLEISTMAAGILLCTLCLLQARPFTMYLQLMGDLYHIDTKLSLFVPSADHVFATRHTIEVMSVMDLPTSVVGRSSPSMGVWRRLRKLQDGWEGGRLGGVEVVSGLPRSFLDILADIADCDGGKLEARLWAWPGEMGVHAQCILWDCWRYSAILDARRLERQKRKLARNDAAGKQVPPDNAAAASLSPSTELVMCRLMASVYALFRAVEMPANHHLLMHNGLIYPMVTASLEVPLLVAHPEWKEVLDDLRASFLRKDSFHVIKMIDEVLEEAWNDGTDTFDIDAAARRRGVEMAVF